ncbi:hypothetical protein AAY473_005490 [Plecturocebus cupreus]
MKLPEEGTGSNPCCSAATVGDSQSSRVWSGPPVVLEQRGLTVRGETKSQKEIDSTSTERMSTQRPHPKATNFKDQRHDHITTESFVNTNPIKIRFEKAKLQEDQEDDRALDTGNADILNLAFSLYFIDLIFDL